MVLKAEMWKEKRVNERGANEERKNKVQAKIEKEIGPKAYGGAVTVVPKTGGGGHTIPVPTSNHQKRAYSFHPLQKPRAVVKFPENGVTCVNNLGALT